MFGKLDFYDFYLTKYGKYTHFGNYFYQDPSKKEL